MEMVAAARPNPWSRSVRPTRVATMRNRSMSPIGTHSKSPTRVGRRRQYTHALRDAVRPTALRQDAERVVVGGSHHVWTVRRCTVRGGSPGIPRPLRDGALYGAALWLFGDELAVPLLGLSDKPTAYHPARHAHSLAQHLGYGFALAAATRFLSGERSAHACSCGCS